MADAPSWLSDTNTTQAPAVESFAVQAPTPEPVSAPTPAVAQGDALAPEDPDAKELPSVILIMRLANMGVASALIAVSVRAI
jgi:hypothetical protein